IRQGANCRASQNSAMSSTAPQPLPSRPWANWPVKDMLSRGKASATSLRRRCPYLLPTICLLAKTRNATSWRACAQSRDASRIWLTSSTGRSDREHVAAVARNLRVNDHDRRPPADTKQLSSTVDIYRGHHPYPPTATDCHLVDGSLS